MVAKIHNLHTSPHFHLFTLSSVDTTQGTNANNKRLTMAAAEKYNNGEKNVVAEEMERLKLMCRKCCSNLYQTINCVPP